MSEIKNGGPAFPPHAESTADEYMGMSLRDYFAAKAMQALIASPRATQEWIKDYAVTSAYQVADEMLKAREEGSKLWN